MKAIGGFLTLTLCASMAMATTAIQVGQGGFTPDAGLITFSEFPLNTNNPVYAPGDYGANPGAPTVSFGGFFMGQSLGSVADCPVGAAVSGCVVGPRNNPLTLDPSSPAAFITTDSANPTSPVLSGSPRFNGAISILFSTDVAGVGLDGGYFDAIGGTAITAFDRAGNVLGQVANNQLGIQFLGLVTNDGSNAIAGLQFSLVGPEPFGFGIDNVRFGTTGQVVVPGVPEPSTWIFLGSGLAVLALARKRAIRA